MLRFAVILSVAKDLLRVILSVAKDLLPGMPSRAREASLSIIGLLVLVVSPWQSTFGQVPTGIAAVDSAAVARGAWRRGQIALRTRNLAVADRELEHAASAWPTQPTYLWGHAVASALSGNQQAAIRALNAYADLGLGVDLASDSIFSQYVDRPAFAQVVRRHIGNKQFAARSRVHAVLSDTSLWPEGVDYDPRRKTWFVTSVRHRTIVAVRDGEPQRDLWARETTGMGAVLAVRVDTLRDVLWATTSGIPQMLGYVSADSTIAALIQVSLPDGAVLHRWNLPVIPGGHVLGDVAIGPGGDVFFSDSNEPVLYRLRAGADTLERTTSPLFRSVQGIAPAPDGASVYVADYSHGIMRVDLRTGQVRRVADAPASTSLGCDGIAWYRNGIVAIQNGVTPARVMYFALDSAGTSFVRAHIIDRNSGLADEPTIGTIVGDEFIYVANSQWEKYRDDGVVKPGARLTAPILLAAPLPR